MIPKNPDTDIDFVITPQYFLAAFDVYDREEDLGRELNKFDPNSRDDLNKLFHDYLLSGKLVERYGIDHKVEIAKALIEILSDEEFDYEKALSGVYDVDDEFSLPSRWEIKDARLFFLEAYRAVCEKWDGELREYGLALNLP